MYTTLSQKEIGQRICELRKLKGLSQDSLAKSMNISRSSFTQIELGNRNINILEFQQLSMVLSFSLDAFLSPNFLSYQENHIFPEQKINTVNERLTAPYLNMSKLKNVLLYMLEKCAGKPNVGETVLYKLLYFSDFNYYELYEEFLTGATYRKLPFGPVPNNLHNTIQQMIEDGSLKRITTTYHGYPQTRYLPLVKADLTKLKASETEILDSVIKQMSDWSAKAISNYSHQDLPWLASNEGEEINYELAFYREAPFSVRNYDHEKEQE